MADREKLAELIKSAKAAMRGKEFTCNMEREYFTAEYLIGHGVTVKEPQKPLMLEEVKNIRDVIVWAELVSGELFPARIDGTRLKNLEHVWEVVRSSYKKGWRFWANRPTKEERMAAEWEK